MSAPLAPLPPLAGQASLGRFKGIWNDIVGYGSGVNRECSSIVAQYERGTRFYHTIDHVVWCIRKVREMFLDDTEYDLSPMEKKGIELSLVYHDIIYDIPGHNNEDVSAAYARHSLQLLKYTDSFIDHVSWAIEDTQLHLPRNYFSAFVCDADLAILAEPPKIYLEYVAKLRKEYGIYSDEEWRGGRMAWLESTLKKPRFFYLGCNERLNHEARMNMQSEMDAFEEEAA